jgi:hypothetical protein
LNFLLGIKIIKLFIEARDIMSRKIALILTLLLSFPIIVAYRTSTAQSNPLTILPEDCRMQAGENMQLALDGHVPPNATISWNVNNGGIVPRSPGSSAIFIAPAESEVVTISVSISSGTPSSETSITRQCIVTATRSVPSGLAEGSDFFDSELASVWLGEAPY